jgi:hypothetical protein
MLSWRKGSLKASSEFIYYLGICSCYDHFRSTEAFIADLTLKLKIKLRTMKKKTLFQRMLIGIQKGWNTPTLPANVLSFERHPLMRIFRVIGGINVGILFWQRYHLQGGAPTFVLYVSLFIASIFGVYLIVLTIIRFKHMWKVLKNHDLDVKN